MTETDGYLRHPALRAAHGFGTRGAREPTHWLRPRQVHGARVAVVEHPGTGILGDADAVVSAAAGAVVGVVTADCVPILVVQAGAVAAIHAGWRGLAVGVVHAAIAALDGAAGFAPDRTAVIGPHICARHYEIDAPVRDALAPDYSAALDAALTPTRPGHWRLDLQALTRDALRRAGFAAGQIFALSDTCTFGDSRRFASRRRDGVGGERLVHWVATPAVARRS